MRTQRLSYSSSSAAAAAAVVVSLCKVLLMVLALIFTLHTASVVEGRSGPTNGPPAPNANEERHNTPGFYN
uniref:Uncharacterized protein n=1 Tax=Oryza punctata TaxID=4537 RepID=A0A0E0MB04_ORYPU